MVRFEGKALGVIWRAVYDQNTGTVTVRRLGSRKAYTRDFCDIIDGILGQYRLL